MKYIDDLPGKVHESQNIWEATPAEQRAAIGQLREQLGDYWRQFRLDPYWLLNRDKGVVGGAAAGAGEVV